MEAFGLIGIVRVNSNVYISERREKINTAPFSTAARNDYGRELTQRTDSFTNDSSLVGVERES